MSLALASVSAVVLTQALLGRLPPLEVADGPLITGSVEAASTLPVMACAAATAIPLALACVVSRTGELRTAHRIAGCVMAASLLSGGVAAYVQGWDIGPISLAAAAACGWVLARSSIRDEAVVKETVPALTWPIRADEIVTHHTLDGQTKSAAGDCETLLGCEAEVLCGTGFFGLVHVQDRVAFRKALDDAASSGSGACAFRAIGSGDGATRKFEMSSIAVCDESGSPFEIVAVSREVSTAAASGAEPDAARDQAEELNRAKSRFIAVASHELRTPLNAIIGFAELLRAFDLKDAPLPQVRRAEYAELIHGAGHHLLEIVNDLLDMSRIEAGRYDTDIAEVDVGETINRCLSMLGAVADERSVRLSNVADRALPPIQADARACRQIVINLVSNAVKFAPAGSAVTVSATLRDDAIVLRVTDSGEGMSEADIARVGEPFTQVGRSGDHADRWQEGTGLGLSIVKGLVALHGGRFELASVPAPRPGHGTDAVVTLPLIHRPQAEAPEVVTFTNKQQALPPQIRSIEYDRVSA